MIARKLLILNFIAIVGTVFHHSVHWLLTDVLFWWPEKFGIILDLETTMGKLGFALFRALDAIAIVAVPIFVFITGYTVTKVISNQTTLKKNYSIVLGRLKHIIIPYLIWSVILIGFRFWRGESFSLEQIWIMLFRGRAAQEYYYIPILVQMYLLAPVLVRLTRKYMWLSLVVIVTINLIARTPFYLFQLTDATRVWWLAIFIDWQAPTYLIWFVCGLIFGFHMNIIYAWIIGHRKLLYGLTLIFLLLVTIEVSWFANLVGKPWVYSNMLLSSQIFGVLLTASLISLDLSKLPYQKTLLRFGVQSFGIYLMHSMILMVSAKTIFHVLPSLLRQPVLFQVVLVILGVSVPLIVMKLVDLTPIKRYSALLFG
jgi:peptidoglycan/LPS O-acetylase OafA/YrhL